MFEAMVVLHKHKKQIPMLFSLVVQACTKQVQGARALMGNRWNLATTRVLTSKPPKTKTLPPNLFFVSQFHWPTNRQEEEQDEIISSP